MSALSSTELNLLRNVSREVNLIIPVMLRSNTSERAFWHFVITETMQGTSTLPLNLCRAFSDARV
jgi:hypothetical protein